MPSPAKVIYASENEYRQHFHRVYCQGPIITFDGIEVRFRREDFDHCMFESSKRDGSKDRFSKERSERIDWIKATLESADAELYQGWDKGRKCCDPDSRVAVVHEEFVVVIRVKRAPGGTRTAKFVTAYLADNSIRKVKGMPKWTGK
jgi:hypothetical protein